jgi:hypothetical protein
MFKEIKKIWLHTTTCPKTGKYSRKSLQMWGSFCVACILGISDILYDVNDIIVALFLGHSLGTTAISVYDKLQGKYGDTIKKGTEDKE